MYVPFISFGSGLGFFSFSFLFWQNFCVILKEDLIPGNVSKWVKVAVCSERKEGKRGFDFFVFASRCSFHRVKEIFSAVINGSYFFSIMCCDF